MDRAGEPNLSFNEDVSISPDAAIGHVHLTVRNLDGMLRFYDGVLGLRRAAAEGDGTVYLSASGRYPFALGLTVSQDAGRRPDHSVGLFHTALLVPSRRWLGRLLVRLVEHAVPLEGASDHRVSEALYLHDPEGNGLEIYADRPRDAWPRLAGQVAMTSAPLDLDALAREGSDGGWTGLPPDARVGHVHLRVSDLARAEAFYHGVLGFDVTQRSYHGALFLSAGGYHHHVGVNIWDSAGAPPAEEGSEGLRSFTVRLRERAELTRIVRRAQRAGAPVEGAADHGIAESVTLRDPDGLAVVLTVDRAGANAAGPLSWRAEPVSVEAALRG